MKYHVNEQGIAKECRAEPGNCPITRKTGGEHYNTIEEAQQSYEKLQENKILPRKQEAYLNDYVDPEKFENFIKKGYISDRTHPNDKTLHVYSYTPKTQFSGMWTPETLLARGLILKTTANGNLKNAKIHARALGKFFTVEQMSEGDWTNMKLVDDDENVTITENAPIDFNATAFVAEKMNGALGVGYIDNEGKLSIATKGSFSSIEAGIGDRILEKYGQKELGNFIKKNMKGETPLFEIITPERPHPVDYGDMEDVILLGTVNKQTGKWSPVDENNPLAEKFSFQTAPKQEATTLGEALKKPYIPNTEGMVVTINETDGQQKMYKIKPKEYHEIRAKFYSMKDPKIHILADEIANKNLLEVKTANDIQFKEAKNIKLGESKAKELMYENYIKPIQDKYNKTEKEIQKFINNNKNISTEALKKKVGTAKEETLPINKSEFFQYLNSKENLIQTIAKTVIKENKNNKK